MLPSKKQQALCYVIGTVLATGIEILNVTTPSVYLAAPVTLLSSLVKIDNTILLSMRTDLFYGVYAVTIQVLVVLAFLLPLIEDAYTVKSQEDQSKEIAFHLYNIC